MARTLTQIDQDIEVERAIWIMERRAGDHCREAENSRAKLDQLLEERFARQPLAMSRVSGLGAGSVHGG